MWKPKYLALSSGGPKGCGHPGALIVLDYWGYLDSLEGIVSCSVGSMIGGLYVLGYTPTEMATLCCEIEINGFKNKAEIIKNLFKGYLSDGKWLKIQLKELILKKTGNEKSTLKDIFEKSKINFVLVTICKDSGKVVYLNHESEPDLPLYKAIMMSCALPGIFKSPTWNGKKYWDGGVLVTHPISYFPRNETLAIKLGLKQAGKQVSSLKNKPKVKSVASLNVFGGIVDIVDTFYGMFTVMSDEIEELKTKDITIREICVDSGTVDTLSFGLKKPQRIKMIASGMRAALAFVISESNKSVKYLL